MRHPHNSLPTTLFIQKNLFNTQCQEELTIEKKLKLHETIEQIWKMAMLNQHKFSLLLLLRRISPRQTGSWRVGQHHQLLTTVTNWTRYSGIYRIFNLS
jgi:hypothetical protein